MRMCCAGLKRTRRRPQNKMSLVADAIDINNKERRKNKVKKLVCMLLAIIMVISLAACGAKTDTGTAAPAGDTAKTEASDTIRLAVVGPMTGQDAMYGTGFRQAAQIMADKWNAEGGCLGKKVEIVVFDDKGSPEEAANVAEQIVADDSIVAVVGHFSSSCSMAASPVYQDHAMLEISPCSSHADYTKTGDWIWRVSPLTTDEARTAAKYVGSYWKSERVGMIIMNTDWGLEIAEYEKEFLKQINPDIQIFEEVVVEGNDDYSSVVTNFVSADVDTVICCAYYPISAPFTKQLRKALPNVNVIGHGNCQVAQLTDIIGEDGNNFTCTCAWSPIFTDDATKYFNEKWAEVDKEGSVPIGDYVQYYDTVGVVLQAIANCGTTDRSAIRAELPEIEYTGLSGILKFDENRDCPRDYGIVYWDTSDNSWHQNDSWNK